MGLEGKATCFLIGITRAGWGSGGNMVELVIFCG